jgi:hypothetical protein
VRDYFGVDILSEVAEATPSDLAQPGAHVVVGLFGQASTQMSHHVAIAGRVLDNALLMAPCAAVGFGHSCL